jgi:hypothetical protein
LADLQASIEERRATEATGIRAAEAASEAERRVASKRSDPRLEAAREADEPDAKLIEKLEFELAESLAPLEVALDEARAISAEAEINAKKAAEERTRLEKDLAEAIASGPATESVAPADRAMAALASRTGGVAFADDLVANCCELTEASREAIDAFDARRRAEEEASAANKGKPPNPNPPPNGEPEPEPEPETRPEEVRVMTWRAFETMYMSTDFGAPEMCPAEARRLAREASAREAEAEKKGAASDAKKGGNKDKDKIAEEDADDAGEEDANNAGSAVPPPHALPGLPRITNATLLAFHELERAEAERLAAEAAAREAREKNGKKKEAAKKRGGGEKEAPPPPEPPKPPALSDRRAGGVFGGAALVRAAAGRPQEKEPEPEPEPEPAKGKK